MDNKMYQNGITNLPVNQCNFLWTINNFSFGYDLNLGKEIESPTFTSGPNNNLVWSLKLNKFQDYNSVEFLSLCLNLVISDRGEEDIPTKFKFSLINNKGLETNTFQNQGVHLFKKTGLIKCEKFIRKDVVLNTENNLLRNDHLKILCQVAVLLNDSSIESSIIENKTPESQIVEDYSLLFDTKKFSDVTLSVTEGSSFEAHKIILAARSPVFAAMFEHEMKERKDNNVNITDITSEVLQEVLRFIYTGKVENLNLMAGDILIAAEKYDLDTLKTLCEEELCNNLTVQNAVEILILADCHRAYQLKDEVIYFINTNPNVTDTKAWTLMKKTNTHLFGDLYKAFAKMESNS